MRVADRAGQLERVADVARRVLPSSNVAILFVDFQRVQPLVVIAEDAHFMALREQGVVPRGAYTELNHLLAAPRARLVDDGLRRMVLPSLPSEALRRTVLAVAPLLRSPRAGSIRLGLLVADIGRCVLSPSGSAGVQPGSAVTAQRLALIGAISQAANAFLSSAPEKLDLGRPRQESVLLTQRAVEVLKLVAELYTNEEIASHLHISPETVKRHVSSILIKLGVASRGEAVRSARALGLLSRS